MCLSQNKIKQVELLKPLVKQLFKIIVWMKHLRIKLKGENWYNFLHKIKVSSELFDSVWH